MKKRILYVGVILDDKWSGGEPIVAKNLISYLKQNYEVFTSYYKPHSFLEKKTIPLMRQYGYTDDTNKKAVKFYIDEIQRVNPDIIVSQYDVDTSIIEASKLNDKKIISYIHIWWPICPKITLLKSDNTICDSYIGNDCYSCILNQSKGKSRYFLRIMASEKIIKQKMNKRIEKLNYDNVYIVVLNNGMKEYFNKYIKNENIFVINNGINLDEFVYFDSNREKIISYLGGQNEVKGYKTFLEIARILHDKIPEVKIYAAGDYSKGLIDNYPYINFLGTIDRTSVVKLLNKSRCTIFPSMWREPAGLVVLESIACGTPVVGSGIENFQYSFKNGEDIFIVDRNDISNFVSKIEVLLNDDALFKTISKNGRRKVEMFADQKKTYKDFESLIEKILES